MWENLLEMVKDPQLWLGALGIFVVRVVSIAMDTLRFMLILRNMKTISWILGFLQSVLFVVIMGTVLSNMDNILNIIGYSAGFATGNLIGMWIESKLAFGYSHLSIVSRLHGMAVAEGLREADFAVTEIPAKGRDGTVALLTVTIRRKQVDEVEKLVLEIDPEAFITSEDIKPVRSGYWGVGGVRR